MVNLSQCNILHAGSTTYTLTPMIMRGESYTFTGSGGKDALDRSRIELSFKPSTVDGLYSGQYKITCPGEENPQLQTIEGKVRVLVNPQVEHITVIPEQFADGRIWKLQKEDPDSST